MEFQIYDYVEEDIKIEDDSSETDDKVKYKTGPIDEYVIHVFGRTMDDKSVYCKLLNFEPRFFIKMPDSWGKKKGVLKQKIADLKKWLKGNDNKKVWKRCRDALIDVQLVSNYKDAIGFTNDKEFYFALLTFKNMASMKKFWYFFDNDGKITIPRVTESPTKFKCYEANIPPMIRCFHLQNITGCSWVRIEKYSKEDEDGLDLDNSYCDIEIETDWKNIHPTEKDCNAPFRIASFDIECNSIDGQFPQARRKGDQVIQIGTTYTKLGESVPYRQHIVCLGKTDNVDGAVTESYDDERDLVLAWKKELIKSDCDIITGYNIFFFDEKYVYDRCDLHLNLKFEMSRISKLKEKGCRFRDFKLASSAMGENMIRYWDTPGRIHVDLMKDVQKTYNLSSYKLDSVASNFIRGKIVKVEKNKNKILLHCENVDDIMEQDYIHIEHVKSFVSDYVGNKYLANKIDIENKIIEIETDVEIEEVEEGSLFWSQAKDDVGPQDIFRLQKGNSADRSIVAKYCVKDCRLVNLLVNKLEVITKNIEMANVCYVPLSYLFVRGQGIKLFSLCLKVYRDYKFLFPVLKKPEESDGGYEGAIVFDPVPNVDYEALVTKDYASLYPSSIIQKNMSHETLVTNEDYDRLDEITYFNAKYKQSDGTIKDVRFAKEGDKLGVVPTILDTLLKERKAVKKKMKVEKDQFKYKILDAKQLALKVTANSLYGQLGAPTSPIFMKSIAACTTSTGREMLIFAKKYDEEILPGFMNGLKYAYLDNDMEMVNKILDMELKDRNNEEFIEKIRVYLLEKLDGLIFQPVIRYGDTDSVFTCFRFKEECKKIKKEESLELWKEIIDYSRELLLFFLPEENRELWINLHNEYYGQEKINKMCLPKPPDVLPERDHWKDLDEIPERMKRFLKEYMEESFMPWFWTLQELFNVYKQKFNEKQFNEILDAKLYKFGDHQVEKMRLSSYDYLLYGEVEDEKEKKEEILRIKKEFEGKLETFFKEKMDKVWIEPYWSVKDTKKIKVKLWKKGKSLTDKRTLDLSIEMGVISGETVKKRLPFPHDLEYEKTFWPFLILTKKRYVGNKYEFDPNKFKQDFMGIVLKRRDNAPIVKEVCNGIIDALINFKDPKKAKKFTKKCVKDMFANKFDINYFVTSKTLKLKESYADWTRIAHVVLAERIGIRDPGNRPQSGDRITFAAIKIPNKTKETLQGEMIETPDFIKKNNLEVDYLFYMTNQIMKPSLQFLELVLNDAENIFNPYIFKDKIDELIKEKISVSKFIADYKKEEFDESMIGGVDYDKMKPEQLSEIIDEMKKENRKLKCDQRKILKAIDVIGKEEVEKNLSV